MKGKAVNRRLPEPDQGVVTRYAKWGNECLLGKMSISASKQAVSTIANIVKVTAIFVLLPRPGVGF